MKAKRNPVTIRVIFTLFAVW